MRITTIGIDFDITPPVIRQAVQAVDRSLTRYEPDIEQVVVRLGQRSDNRATPRNQLCSLHVYLPEKTIRIEESDDDLFRALKSAIDRAEDAVAEHVEEKRQRRRELLSDSPSDHV